MYNLYILIGRTDWIEICHSIWTNRFTALSSLMTGIWKRNENGLRHSSWLARFDQKMSYHSLGYSHWSLTGRVGKHPYSVLDTQLGSFCIGRKRISVQMYSFRFCKVINFKIKTPGPGCSKAG